MTARLLTFVVVVAACPSARAQSRPPRVPLYVPPVRIQQPLAQPTLPKLTLPKPVLPAPKAVAPRPAAAVPAAAIRAAPAVRAYQPQPADRTVRKAEFTLNNRTSRKLSLYVDGRRVATAYPWAQANTYVTVGYHYFKAVMPDGRSVSKGGTVGANGVRWTITEEK